MRTREEIEEEFFGDDDYSIEKYRSDKEQHFMEVLLDIRDLLKDRPTS